MNLFSLQRGLTLCRFTSNCCLMNNHTSHTPAPEKLKLQAANWLASQISHIPATSLPFLFPSVKYNSVVLNRLDLMHVDTAAAPTQLAAESYQAMPCGQFSNIQIQSPAKIGDLGFCSKVELGQYLIESSVNQHKHIYIYSIAKVLL